jgi:hypothetical protein
MRRSLAVLNAIAIAASSAAFAEAQHTGKVCDVTQYGAKGDGKTLDSAAIVAAVGDCGKSGGQVVLPSPGRYLSAPFNLTSNLVFEVEAGATLLAATDTSLWPVVSTLPSYPDGVENDPGMSGRYTAFIGGSHLTNVTISGGGTIDGQGLVWWQRSGRLPGHKKTLLHTRGRLIEPMYSSDIVIRDVTLKDSPFWAVHLYCCDQVTIEGVTIEAPVWSRNTDCVDPDSSSNVLVRNCTLSGGDDQIAIKSGQDAPGREFGRPSVNITIEDVVVPHGDGMSIGSEMSGGVMNVTIRRVKLQDVLHPLRIKTGYGRGGAVSGILFEDIELASLGQLAGTAITVDEFDNNILPNASHAKDGWPSISNVTFRNIHGGALTAGEFDCLPELPCTGIELENITLTHVHGFSCKNAHGEVVGTVKPDATCLSPGTAAALAVDAAFDGAGDDGDDGDDGGDGGAGDDALAAAAPVNSNTTTVQYEARDPARKGRRVRATVVYPATPPPSPSSLGVIAFAHGFGLPADGYDYIASGLADAGFIVAFPQAKGAPKSLDLAEDQSFLLAHIVNESATNPQSPFFNLAMNRTAVMGHSLGGGTSLIAADPTYLRTDYPAPTAIATLSLGTYTVPSAMKSVPLIASTTPMLLLTASEDCIDPPAKNSMPVINASRSQCAVLHSLVGGCHCQYADKSIGCSTTEKVCGAKPNITRQQQFDRTLSVVTPWLESVLLSKEGAWKQYATAVSGLRAAGQLATLSERTTACPAGVLAG